MSNPPEKTLKKRFVTEVVKPTARNIALCADEILRGGVVAFPTETVYGLGANALDERAVGRIFKIKGRPTDNPLIVHTHDFLLVKEFATSIPSIAKDLFAKFSPGPLTLILKKKKCMPDITTAGLPSVAVRIPSHTTALTFLKACAVPLSAPSANCSGTPSPTTAQHVYDDLNGRLPFILDGG
ncbi:MAG: L-threonylcarbamoyladenylate synthase, partial [Firmicutes bacterium]|nr:L-threonylcarbamoyladenylate synthase [Bacillota bacterium]